MYLIIDEFSDPSIVTELTPAIREALHVGIVDVYTVKDGAFVWVDKDGTHNPITACDWAYGD